MAAAASVGTLAKGRSVTVRVSRRASAPAPATKALAAKLTVAEKHIKANPLIMTVSLGRFGGNVNHNLASTPLRSTLHMPAIRAKVMP